MEVILLKHLDSFFLEDSVFVRDILGHTYIGLFNGFKLKNPNTWINRYQHRNENNFVVNGETIVSHISLRNCHIKPANSTLSRFKKTRYKYKMIDWVVEISPARTVLFEKTKKQVRLKRGKFIGYDWGY